MREWSAVHFNRILVPLDGSSLAESALDFAVKIAQANQAEILLLQVTFMKEMLISEWGIYGYSWWEQAVEQNRQEAVHYLERVQQTLIPSTIAVRTLVLDGNEPGIIVDTAEAEQVNLIVMSTHGRSGFIHKIIGSVAGKVLRTAACPVLVTRPVKPSASSFGPTPVDPAEQKDTPVAKLLIALDGSELAEKALPYGISLAGSFGAEVTLLQVIKRLQGLNMAQLRELEQAEPGLVKEAQAEHYHRAGNYLQRIADESSQQTGRILKTVVLDGPVAESIINYAATEQVDIIVMTSHGRSALARWFYGRVTEKVLYGAPCAVMLIRPPAFRRRKSTR